MTMLLGSETLYKLSLKDIALRKVASLLCSQHKVYELVLGMQNEREVEIKEAINGVSREILAELALPATTKEELANLMIPLVCEVLKWLRFHTVFLWRDVAGLSDINVLKLICWKKCNMGTVDYRETAEALIRHGKLGIFQRFKLACLYCLEPYVRDLWKILPDNCKETVYNFRISSSITKSVILVVWAYKVERRLNQLYDILYHQRMRHSSVYQYAFECSAVLGYRTATQYFFEKLTSKEKDVSLVRTACSVANVRSFDNCFYVHEYQKFSDVMCYLFSLMTEAQVMDVIKRRPCETLLCFMDWPWQDAFFEFAIRAFPYLSNDTYGRLLYTLARNTSVRYNYSNVYRNFFLISPTRLTEYTLTTYAHFLRPLFRNGDVESVKFVLRTLNADEKIKLALGIGGSRVSVELIREDKWDFLELYYKRLELSKEDQENHFASFAIINGTPIATLLSVKGKYEWFQQLMIEADPNTPKCNEETSVPSTETLERPTERPSKIQKVTTFQPGGH